MKRFLAGATAGLMLVAASWVGGTGAAMADYQSDRDALCGKGDANNCTITIKDKDWDLVEGVSSATVEVVGTPGVTSRLKMYTFVLSQTPGQLDLIKSWGTPLAFKTDASGKATVKVPIATLSSPWGAFHPVAFQLADSTLVLMNSQPIQPVDGYGIPDFIRVRSARGALVNYFDYVTDGLLQLRVAGGLTGDVYGVQFNINGKWRDVTNTNLKNNGLIGKDGRAIVYANVSGYADGEYQLRVFNRSRGIYDLALDPFNQGTVALEKNIYITPGEHNKNGRKWRTTCEPYSATQRCRTEIWSTEVVYSKGKLVKNTGWHFNNLTYKESKRALWKGNPLGNTGKYTIAGRQWRTECDTAVSGGNGCRSYIVSDVVAATKKGNGYTYKLVRKEVFNNIVLFTPSN
ncbi:MAG: hypothetical protein Q4P15_13695 [Propionibacteriaceae bacterium]|nr:hypothetical protein [Propionibacteriaceae bacterium]